MRSIKLIFLATLLLIASACKKGDKTSDISIDEVATLAMNAIASDSNGFFKYILMGTGNAHFVIMGTSGEVCGNTYTENSTAQGDNNAFTSFNSTLNYASTLNCNGGQYDNIVNKTIFTITGDGSRLKVTDAGKVDLKVAGLNAAANNLITTGTYNRTGTFTSKLFTRASGTSTVAITNINITSARSNSGPMTGTANINVLGSTNSGSFNYSGTMVFDSTGGIMTLTMGGATFNIDVFRSTYTKK